MQFFPFVAARADTGAVLPYGKATVYLTGTMQRAALFGQDGNGIDNPLACDVQGAGGFAAANGVYDIAITSADGGYSVPPIPGVQLYDMSELDTKIADVDAAVTQAGSYSASAGAALTQILSSYYPIWPLDPHYGEIVFANERGEILFGLDSDGQVINERPLTYPVWPLDPHYGQGLTVDPNGGIIVELDAGTGQIVNFALPSYPIWPLDPYYGAGVVANERGQILLYTPITDAEIFDDYASGILADGSVYAVGPNGSVRLAVPLAGASAVTMKGNVVRWSDGNATDGTGFRQIDLGGLAALPATVTKLRFYPMSGQSLTNGTNGTPVISATPPAPGKVLAFNGWARPIQDTAVGAAGATTLVPIRDQQLGPLADLAERFANVPASFDYFGETQGGGFAAYFGGTLPADTVAVFGSFGVGGARVTQLNKGTNPYANMIRAVERLAAWCALSGRVLSVPAMLWDQGFENVQEATPVATYTAQLTQMQSDFTSDVNALLTVYGFAHNTSGQVPMLCWQESNAAKAGVSYSDLAAVYVDLTIANPTKFAVVGPQYWNANVSPVDYLHYLGMGYRLFGEMLARGASRFAQAGSAGALYMTGAVNSGTAITITTNAATQIVLDSTDVTDPGQYGLVLIDDTEPTNATTIALSSIAVSGTNKITATAASALTVGRSYSIGMAYYLNGSGDPNTGPTSGARACFRDSAPESFSAAAGAGRMYDWACHQRFHFNAA